MKAELHFWNKRHTRLLRVQQSMNGPYRVVSIRPEDATTFFASNYTVPTWANRHKSPSEAKKEMKAYAALHELEEWRAAS